MKCKAQFHFRASMRHAVSIQAHVIYDGRQLFLNLMSQYKESVDRLTVSVVRARREWYGAGRATAEPTDPARPTSRGTYLNYGAGAVWTREGSIVTTEGRGGAAGQGTAGLLAADHKSRLPTAKSGAAKRRASLSRTSPPRTMTKRLANDPVSAAASSRLQRSSARSQAGAIPQKRSTASKPSSKVCAGACLVQPTR